MTEIIETAEVVEVEGTEVEETVMPTKTASDKVKSLTNGDWIAGYGTADLRAWLRFWTNEKRSKGHALELANKDERFIDMKREDHVRMLTEEIAARDAARSKGGPNA